MSSRFVEAIKRLISRAGGKEETEKEDPSQEQELTWEEKLKDFKGPPPSQGMFASLPTKRR